MRYSMRRIGYMFVLFCGILGLIVSVMPKTPSAASSTPKAQSKAASNVDAARFVLEQARAKERANSTVETVRASTEALKAYKAAVDARCAEINKRFAELAGLRPQVGDTTEIDAEVASLEQEFKELKNSLIEYYQIQPKELKTLNVPAITTGPLAQFCNASLITINNGGPATPYPSNISVSGQTGVVTSVTVTLNGFGHQFPDDVDILLVGPQGQNAIIMSDVGGGTAVSGLTLTLDDAAANNLPNSGPLVSGTFKPTDIADGIEIFPAPAPAPLGGSALSIFNGTDPNGVWQLYVKDDSAGDGGSITGGWCLNITTQIVTPCVLTCPADVTRPNDAGQCGAVVTYALPTTTGTCGTVTCSPPSGSFFPIGTTAVNCTATGGGSCSFTVTVTGTCNTSNPCNPTAITINAGGPATPYPSNISVSGQTGVVTSVTVTLNGFGHQFPDDVDILLVGPQGQNAIIMSDVGGGTAVSGLTLTLDDAAANNLPDAGPLVSGTFKPTDFGGGTEIFPAPAPAPLGGSALSVFNGTDPNGVWQLYVKDDSAGDGGSITGGWCLNIMTQAVTPCVLTCPADVTQPNDAGQCGAVVTYASPTTTGTCGTVTCSPPSGSFFPIGTTAVNCTATGGGSCAFTVTITGTCPGGCNPTAITINAGGPATPYPSALAISGLIGTVSHVTVTLNGFGHQFPDDVDILLVGPQGQNAIIMSDVGGGTAVSGLTLTLDDAAANSLPNAGPLVSGTFKPTDIADGIEIFPAPAPAPLGGSALSVFNGTDPNGVWQLYVKDDSAGDGGSITGGWCLSITVAAPPCNITCPANVTQSNDANQCGAVVTYASPTTTGTCGTVTCSPASGSFFPTGTTTVTCTAASGPSCSFTVTINDTQAPTITCPSNITQSTDLNQCSAVVTYPAPTVSDNCPGVGSPTCNPASGSTFQKGVTTVNCTVSDASGNSASCSFSVTVNDTQAPTITCPGNITQSTDANQCSATVTYPAPTVSDNCPGVGSPTCNPASGSTFQKGTTTVTCAVMDSSKNESSCSFTVTVNDTQAPTITCPANIVIPAAMGQCSRAVTFNVTASDNCPGVTVVTTPPSGSTFPKGTTTVNATATDASGNTATCSFTVTVVDTQPPSITCPPNMNVSIPTGQPCGVVTYATPTATDNCPGTTVVCNPPSGSCFPAGVTTVTCTATDASGNLATCSFAVSTFDFCIEDDDNPTTVLRFNSMTGDYIFCCGGTVYTGTGTVTHHPNMIRLEDNTASRSLSAKVQLQSQHGNATLQSPPGHTLCSIKDKDITNNSCACP